MLVSVMCLFDMMAEYLPQEGGTTGKCMIHCTCAVPNMGEHGLQNYHCWYYAPGTMYMQ